MCQKSVETDKPQYDYWYWHEIRQQLLIRDGRCLYCGKILDKYNITIDHMIPRTKGGSNEMDNLVASCRPCNDAKKDMLPLDFILSRLYNES